MTWIETDLDRLKELTKQEALKQTAAERNQILEEAARVQQDSVWNGIFRTPVQGLGIPDDTVANRQIISGWLDEARGDVFSVDWFAKVISEQPLANQISWTIPLSAKERKAQEEKNALALQDLASDKIRRFNLADNEANRKAIMAHPNDDIAVLPDGPVILTDGDDPIIELIAASPQELHERHQQYLRTLRKNNDIAGLRRAAALEREETAANMAELRLHHRLLKGFADCNEFLLPPLPSHWLGKPLDATYIRQHTNRQDLAPIVRKHGMARIDALLNGLDESFFANWQHKLRQVEFQLTGIASSSH